MMDPLSRIISSFSMYKFLLGLTTPFEKFPAYKLGVINEHGFQIKPDNTLTEAERASFDDFTRLVVSLKRIINLVPDPYVRSYMKSPVTAVKLMSEECKKLGGDPQYFTLLAARELVACQYISEEAGAAIAASATPANSVGGGGVYGLVPNETTFLSPQAQARWTRKRNHLRRRKAPVSESIMPIPPRGGGPIDRPVPSSITTPGVPPPPSHTPKTRRREEAPRQNRRRPEQVQPHTSRITTSAQYSEFEKRGPQPLLFSKTREEFPVHHTRTPQKSTATYFAKGIGRSVLHALFADPNKTPYGNRTGFARVPERHLVEPAKTETRRRPPKRTRPASEPPAPPAPPTPPPTPAPLPSPSGPRLPSAPTAITTPAGQLISAPKPTITPAERGEKDRTPQQIWTPVTTNNPNDTTIDLEGSLVDRRSGQGILNFDPSSPPSPQPRARRRSTPKSPETPKGPSTYVQSELPFGEPQAKTPNTPEIPKTPKAPEMPKEEPKKKMDLFGDTESESPRRRSKGSRSRGGSKKREGEDPNQGSLF